MNIEILKECLKSWITADTWHTSHPCDEERFNKAINESFEKLGYEISGDDFDIAIKELVDELHPTLDKEYTKGLINNFAIKAETIGSFLLDTK